MPTFNQYLRSFVIGSSLPVVAHFFFQVGRIPKDKMNYSYEKYTLIAPLYFGLMNAFSLYMQDRYSLSFNKRFLIFGIISAIVVNTVVRLFNSYNISGNEWYRYTIRVSALHLITWFVIIKYLEKSI